MYPLFESEKFVFKSLLFYLYFYSTLIYNIIHRYIFYFTGKLSFREPLHEPRVYSGAPAGVHVTTIRAYDPGRKSIMYNLLDVRDHSYFAMEPSSGNITTAKKIDKKVGDTYEVSLKAYFKVIFRYLLVFCHRT